MNSSDFERLNEAYDDGVARTPADFDSKKADINAAVAFMDGRRRQALNNGTTFDVEAALSEAMAKKFPDAKDDQRFRSMVLTHFRSSDQTSN